MHFFNGILLFDQKMWKLRIPSVTEITVYKCTIFNAIISPRAWKINKPGKIYLGVSLLSLGKIRSNPQTIRKDASEGIRCGW